jgi:hypothetical protein
MIGVTTMRAVVQTGLLRLLEARGFFGKIALEP